MLKTLDRYIILKYLSTFFFTVLIITMIGVIIDFSEKVEKFIEEPITIAEIAGEYYPSFILYLSGLLWPLFCLMAVIFFTSRMAYNSEIISILNAGISFNRLLRPYVVAASFLTAIYLLGAHIVIPWGNQHMFRILHTYISKNEDKAKVRDIHLFIAPNTTAFIGYYSKGDSTARDFRIEEFEGARLKQVLKADRAEWQKDSLKWRIYDYELRSFNGIQETFYSRIGQQFDTLLNIGPEDFIDYASQQNMMSTPALLKHIRKQEVRGAGNASKYRLEFHRRNAEPFTIFILTIIGMTIAARKIRGGIGLHLALGIGIGAIYIFFSKFASTFVLGSSFPVWLGAWMPNLIFAGVAVFFFKKAQK
jgi:lipopolysaccharide export system permease protein